MVSVPTLQKLSLHQVNFSSTEYKHLVVHLTWKHQTTERSRYLDHEYLIGQAYANTSQVKGSGLYLTSNVTWLYHN
jgi:hypothetical protein